mmetsp:Transcript_24829/g.57890  ORF Transcript_24829/g.57890 Transcript_24829/m.57890 type:complete len:167 (-) Transcript_24829:715-1215(-)
MVSSSERSGREPFPAICRSTSCAYSPAVRRSSSCVPFSMTRPLETTQMQCALRTVDSRCATTSVVRSAMSRSMASWTMCSDSASSAEVASSRRSTFGDISTARAIAIRCFWPPESCSPRSPTQVSYPSGKAEMNACALAVFAAASTGSSGTSREASRGSEAEAAQP